MVAHHIASQQMHKFVKHVCAELFKQPIRITIISYPIHDLTAFLIALYKFIQRFYVLLQVGIYGNHHVSMLPGGHHSR